MPNLNDLIGLPYKDGGRGPYEFDCLGLSIEVFKRFGIEFPNVDPANMAVEEISRTISDELSNHVDILKDWQEIKKPEVPCLVLLRGHIQFISHLGVCLGHGKFIHATKMLNSRSVSINRLSDWEGSIAGYYKYVG